MRWIGWVVDRWFVERQDNKWYGDSGNAVELRKGGMEETWSGGKEMKRWNDDEVEKRE